MVSDTNLYEQLERPFLVTLSTQPSWTLRDPVEEDHLNHGHCALQRDRDPPSNIRVVFNASEYRPGGDDSTEIPLNVVLRRVADILVAIRQVFIGGGNKRLDYHRGDFPAVLRIGQLGYKKR